MSDTDTIPCIAWHRDVGLHDGQEPERLELVKAEIDFVIGLHDLVELVDYVKDPSHAPEARLLAGAKAEAILAGYGEDRQKRPAGFSVELLQAYTAGLDSVNWRSPLVYGSLFCDPSKAVQREVPLADE